MRSYFRVMAGKGSSLFNECVQGGFIGADFEIFQDLTNHLGDDYRDFNKEFIPIFQHNRPQKSKIAAGLACGMLWTISKGMSIGDRILCPDGKGRYRIGEVSGDYFYHPGDLLPHRRPVAWLDQVIDRNDMSPALKNSTGMGTVSEISHFAGEIELLMSGRTDPVLIVEGEVVEDAMAFQMEKYLEEFLVTNWKSTQLGKEYDIYEEDGVPVGQQYNTDTGPLDVLAISKDRKTLLVVELKRGKASDSVVGQIQRYMGYVMDVIAEENQSVRGAIIALEDDLRIRRALMVAPNIDFYRYEVSFTLKKA